MNFSLKRTEIVFLFIVYLFGVGLRLIPRLDLDPHMLTFQADIWYRLCMAQYLLDHGQLPPWDIRYMAYGYVPLWYNPFSLYFLAFLAKVSHLDLPTVCSRLMPFVESLSFLPFYFLCRALYSLRVAVIATIFLLLSPSYLFWAGISTFQSLTIFLLPLVILLWVRFIQGHYVFGDKWRHLIFLGILLAVDFLFHLSYFTLLLIWACVQAGLLIERRSRLKDCLYLLVPILLSQLLTIWWWLPGNLYWWWTWGLTSSSGFVEGVKYLTEYGASTAILGHLAFIGLLLSFLLSKRIPAFYLIPIAWALFPMIESHNEGLLKLIQRPGWAWNNFFKPLEGFRFYIFLVQPLALCFALAVEKFLESRPGRKFFPGNDRLLLAGAFFCLVLAGDLMFLYKLPTRFRNTGMELKDIKAAQWFRNHSNPTDRILAEYYTAQMFSGICGGKALLGSMFPLKHCSIPYITDASTVQKDIYSVYISTDIRQVEKVLRRYNCTHVFVSDKEIFYVAFLTKQDNSIEDVDKIDKEGLKKTLFNEAYFETVYSDGDLKILKWKGPEPRSSTSR